MSTALATLWPGDNWYTMQQCIFMQTTYCETGLHGLQPCAPAKLSTTIKAKRWWAQREQLQDYQQAYKTAKCSALKAHKATSLDCLKTWKLKQSVERACAEAASEGLLMLARGN
ncbi:hypothetical protein DACRYDRAFT_106564 [Dacryopinax primogenitus]|uniref:Uncharacterized protein n=1 Tax=Dacryopinax primogenitus (strain DJM 731) TaxID=1858805 RepID=M5GEM9_DACPD|nr:uncharacterized protein DACRYDRAFT_106564 [Dacryopinax primogenitus]EJU03408.1 hypothetical protein DACRYDRAFT_106564 [Dacryopinax primogenitus]